MSSNFPPAESSSEGRVLNNSPTTTVFREGINMSSGEEGDSLSPQSHDSIPTPTHQRRRPRTTWNETARLGLIQLVHQEKPYSMGHGQIGKAWENIAGALSIIPPFVDAGGIRAEACSQKYAAMLKDHREKVAKGLWESGKREGECEAVQSLLNECMSEEQEVLDGRGKKHGEGKGKEKEQEKEARPEKLLEAPVAPAGSRALVPGGECRETPDCKPPIPPSSSSSYHSSLESTMAGYLASLTDSPNTKRRKQETQFMDAKRRLEESEMMRRILGSREESPDTKRRRKDIEASDATVRRMDAENRRLELELRQQEVKANQAVQQGTLDLIAKLVDKLSGDP